MGRQVVGDVDTKATAVCMEAFAVVARPAECLILLLYAGQELVELLVMRPMYVMCELWIGSERFTAFQTPHDVNAPREA